MCWLYAKSAHRYTEFFFITLANENNPNPPKTAYFRRIFICRLYKVKALSHPPHKNPHENHARFGSQIFWGADFLQSEAQNAVNPNGLTSILTRQCEKSTLKKRVRIILVCLVWQDSNLPRFRSPPFRLRLCVHFCKALALLQISRFAE